MTTDIVPPEKSEEDTETAIILEYNATSTAIDQSEILNYNQSRDDEVREDVTFPSVMQDSNGTACNLDSRETFEYKTINEADFRDFRYCPLGDSRNPEREEVIHDDNAGEEPTPDANNEAQKYDSREYIVPPEPKNSEERPLKDQVRQNSLNLSFKYGLVPPGISTENTESTVIQEPNTTSQAFEPSEILDNNQSRQEEVRGEDTYSSFTKHSNRAACTLDSHKKFENKMIDDADLMVDTRNPEVEAVIHHDNAGEEPTPDIIHEVHKDESREYNVPPVPKNSEERPPKDQEWQSSLNLSLKHDIVPPKISTENMESTVIQESNATSQATEPSEILDNNQSRQEEVREDVQCPSIMKYSNGEACTLDSHETFENKMINDIDLMVDTRNSEHETVIHCDNADEESTPNVIDEAQKDDSQECIIPMSKNSGKGAQNTLLSLQETLITMPLVPKIDDGDFIKEFIGLHNRYRAKHNVPHLEYSKELSIYSQNWAENLAVRNVVENSNSSYGENIFYKAGLDVDPNEPVDSWYREGLDYPYGSTDFQRETGHFTQLIWKETREFSIGIARNPSTGTYVVAHYYPPGNIRGRFTSNVLPPID